MISVFLLVSLARLVPVTWLRHKDVELVVANRVRMPDLLVLGEELASVLSASGRSTITEDMPAPLLAVEVVLLGKVNEDRDYRFKRSEYAARGILEYWIVDPGKEKGAVLTLVDGWHEVAEYTGGDSLRDGKADRPLSSVLPGFEVTVDQMLQAGDEQ